MFLPPGFPDTINPEKIRTFCKTHYKTRICDFLIVLNFYLTDKSTKTVLFNVLADQLNCICEHKYILNLMPETHSKKAEKPLLNVCDLKALRWHCTRRTLGVFWKT